MKSRQKYAHSGTAGCGNKLLWSIEFLRCLYVVFEYLTLSFRSTNFFTGKLNQ